MKYSLILWVVFLYSCGSTVAVDYDEQVQFSEFTTYNYYPDIDSGLNELDDKRVIAALDSLMLQKGFQKSENPQLLLNFFAKEYLSNSRSTLGIGIGGGGGNVGVGVSGGIPIGGREVEQQFTLDFVDANNDALVWQGMLVSSYKEKATPRQKEQHYFKVLHKILNKYPPKVK